MTTSIRRKAIVILVSTVALATAAPAFASPIDPIVDSPQATAPQATTPHGLTSTLTLRRDGSQAQQFVADVGQPAATSNGDGFDYGDAAIGAGAALLVAALAGMGAGTVREHRQRNRQLPASPQNA